MTREKDYREVNRESWNKRTEIHINSDFYNQTAFLEGNNTLKSIELDLLGDVTGKSVLHLQCHFGQDTISLARMGAHATGMDLSDKAIEKARKIALEVGVDTRFVCCDLYDLPHFLDEQFDVVFTSYGTIGWLPDLSKWAAIVSRFLTPGGKFVFVEFHPVVWMFDNKFEKIGYNYFNSGAIIETESGTYADRDAKLVQEYISWNHSLSEVINSLISNELEINSLDEFDYSPYNCFNGAVEVEPEKYRIEHLGNKIPLVYAISATKKRLR